MHVNKLMLCGLLLLTAGSVRSQDQTPAGPNPAFPEIFKSAFNPTLDALPEAVASGPEGLNPATLALPDSFTGKMWEADYGRHATRSMHLDLGVVSYATKVGSGAARVSLYGYHTNTAVIPATGPAAARHSGESLELVYARPVSKTLLVGIAILPHDKATTRLSLGGTPIAQGSAHSTLNGRLGALWTPGKWRVGGVWSVEKDNASSQLAGVPVGTPAVRTSFTQRTATYGVSYTPRPGTVLFYNRQRFTVKGDAPSYKYALSYWGAQQWLDPKTFVQLAKVDKGVMAGFGKALNAHTLVTVSYTYRAFVGNEPLYGRGNIFYLTISRS